VLEEGLYKSATDGDPGEENDCSEGSDDEDDDADEHDRRGEWCELFEWCEPCELGILDRLSRRLTAGRGQITRTVYIYAAKVPMP